MKRHEIQTEAEMSQFVKSLLVKLRLVRGQQRSKCHAGILSLFVIAANQQPAMTINKLLENRSMFEIILGQAFFDTKILTILGLRTPGLRTGACNCGN